MSDESEGALDWKTRLAILAGGAALRALAATWRIRVRNEEALLSLRAANRAFIFSLWHGQLLPLLWHHRKRGVAVLISEHRDGELVARAAASLGYRLIRGSSTHGAERALLGLVRDLRRGIEVAITPDGPRGPSRKFAPGALVAANRAGVPILPVAASADRSWRLESWDRFMIPKPFARVTVAYGDAVEVEAADPREAADQVERFEVLMNRVSAAADA